MEALYHSLISNLTTQPRATQVATWNRPRSMDELRSFVESKHAELTDVEL